MKQPHQTCISLQALMRLFFLCLLFHPHPSLLAQALHFKNLGIDDGLSSSHVFDITEDRSGYFWIATDKGITRFDGSEFRNLNTVDGYSGRGAYRIFKSSANELWVVTMDFKLFRVINGKCSAVKVPFDIGWITENNAHEMIGVSRNGTIFKLSGAESKCDTLFTVKRMVGNTNFYTICHVSEGQYIVSSREGIYDVDVKVKQQRLLIADKISNKFNAPRVFKTGDGRVYIFNTIGLYVLNRTKSGTYDIRKLKDAKGEDIISICKDPLSDNLWIGTSNGLYQWQVGNSTFKPIQYLKDVICYNLFISKERILWCTTSDNGIFYTDISSLHFTKETGLKNEHIAFLRKEGNTIYAISREGQIALIENRKILQNWNVKEDAQLAVIYNAANCEDGIYLVLDQNKFIRITNKSKSTITSPQGSFPLFDNNTIFYAYKGGAYRANPFRLWYRGADLSKLTELSEKERLGNGFIRNLHDSLLIYATRRGFFVIHVDNPDTIDYHIINTIISSMVETAKGSWIFSTPDKGIYIEHFSGTKRFYSSDKMLISDYCSKLYYHNGEIWAATNKGISRIILDNRDSIIKVINYTGQDKLISREVNDILFDNGTVYVATNKGISYFTEQPPADENYSPVVLVDRIQINNKDTIIQDSYTLPFTQNNITISYNSPSVRSAKNMQYRYAIVGKETRTIFGVSSSKVLQLGSLAPDEYVMNIWARNIDGIWSITPARLNITILQPFWERIEFILSVTAIVLLFVLLVIIRRVNQIKERNSMQALLLDSELKALRLHMNPHFIFNTLNSFQKFILERNPLEANKYIAKFSKLMRWIMIYSDRQHLSLEEELLFLDTYIELEQLRFDTVFRVIKNIDEELVTSQVFIPALVIQPFVENAIKYGITGITYQGELRLWFEQRTDYLKVTIEDNGVGRAVVKQEQHLSGKEYESTGIKYTNERLLLLLESKLKITNAVTVTDLYEAGKPSGTKVELIIPYYNE